jgi:hypothetical protein
MCLKFLLENNPANQALVSSLEAREVVPPPDAGDAVAITEALDKLGLDVTLGSDGRARMSSGRAVRGGRVGLQRKQGRVEELREEVEALGLPVNGEETVGKGKGKERALEFDDGDDGEIEFM